MPSQNNENELIAQHFAAHPPVHGNRVLDIGAWDGVNLSNSRPQVEAGWQAVLVEGAAGPFTALMNACRGFNATRLVQAFIIGDMTPMPPSRLICMHHTYDAVSTADPVVYEAWRGAVKDYFPIVVPVIRVKELLSMFPGPYDLITLDTEGETYSIFLDVIELTECSCLVVEHAAGGVSYLNVMRAAAIAKGYREIGVNGENLIFVK